MDESIDQKRTTRRRPPHLWFEDSQPRAHYSGEGQRFLRHVLDFSPERAQFGLAQSAAKHLGDLLATPENDPVPAPALGEMPDFDAEFEAQLESDQDTEEVCDRFTLFHTITRRWGELGIGAVRTPYFLNFIGTELGDEDPLKIGGFPASPGSAPSYITKVEAIPTTQRMRDWLAYDALLGDVLEMLGTSWSDVESVIAEAFAKSLPQAYRTAQGRATCALPRALEA